MKKRINVDYYYSYSYKISHCFKELTESTDDFFNVFRVSGYKQGWIEIDRRNGKQIIKRYKFDQLSESVSFPGTAYNCEILEEDNREKWVEAQLQNLMTIKIDARKQDVIDKEKQLSEKNFNIGSCLC